MMVPCLVDILSLPELQHRPAQQKDIVNVFLGSLIFCAGSVSPVPMEPSSTLSQCLNCPWPRSGRAGKEEVLPLVGQGCRAVPGTLGPGLHSGSPTLALAPPLGLQFLSCPPSALLQLEGSVRLWEPAGIGADGRQVHQEGEPRARGVPGAPPSARTAGSQVHPPQPPTPRGSGSLSVRILL